MSVALLEARLMVATNILKGWFYYGDNAEIRERRDQFLRLSAAPITEVGMITYTFDPSYMKSLPKRLWYVGHHLLVHLLHLFMVVWRGLNPRVQTVTQPDEEILNFPSRPPPASIP